MRTQVTFDTADPHAQSAFWAAVPGLEIEDHADFVDQLVADGRLPAKAAEVDRLTALGVELIETHDDRGPLTYVLRDLEGNEFCLHW